MILHFISSLRIIASHDLSFSFNLFQTHSPTTQALLWTLTELSAALNTPTRAHTNAPGKRDKAQTAAFPSLTVRNVRLVRRLVSEAVSLVKRGNTREKRPLLALRAQPGKYWQMRQLEKSRWHVKKMKK